MSTTTRRRSGETPGWPRVVRIRRAQRRGVVVGANAQASLHTTILERSSSINTNTGGVQQDMDGNNVDNLFLVSVRNEREGTVPGASQHIQGCGSYFVAPTNSDQTSKGNGREKGLWTVKRIREYLRHQDSNTRDCFDP
jgi:hypothetical protein